MIALAREYGAKNVGWIAVNANDATRYPDDGMQPMKTRASAASVPLTSATTRRPSSGALGALHARALRLRQGAQAPLYHGRIDDNHRDPSRVTSHDL